LGFRLSPPTGEAGEKEEGRRDFEQGTFNEFENLKMDKDQND
jgi:hypothetical protein